MTLVAGEVGVGGGGAGVGVGEDQGEGWWWVLLWVGFDSHTFFFDRRITWDNVFIRCWWHCAEVIVKSAMKSRTFSAIFTA